MKDRNSPRVERIEKLTAEEVKRDIIEMKRKFDRINSALEEFNRTHNK